MIRNVVFDIGQVLISFEWRLFLERILGGKTAQAVYKATWENPAWNELDTALRPFESITADFVKAAPEYEEHILTAIRRMGECAVKMPYTDELLKLLRANGKSVYYLSNYFEYLKDANPDALDFTRNMDGGIFSFEVHCAKPDPRIYRLLCEKYGIIPQESVFVDDRRENIACASALGFSTVLFVGRESISDVLAAAECSPLTETL